MKIDFFVRSSPPIEGGELSHNQNINLETGDLGRALRRVRCHPRDYHLSHDQPGAAVPEPGMMGQRRQEQKRPELGPLPRFVAAAGTDELPAPHAAREPVTESPQPMAWVLTAYSAWPIELGDLHLDRQTGDVVHRFHWISAEQE